MEGLFVNKVSTDLFVGDCSIVVAPHEVHLLVVFVEHVGTNLDELRLCSGLLNLLRVCNIKLQFCVQLKATF